MKFAAIADVHSNHLALEAVLDDIRAQGIADIVNLGDAASGPLDAARTIDLLIDCGAVSIRGNHDRYLIERAPEKMGSWDRPAYGQLESRHFAWLRNLPPTRLFGDGVFLCHGTPASDETYWLEAVTPDGQVALASAESIAATAADIEHPLILCGHTHVARAVRLEDGRMIVNPGSVGSPAYRDVHPAAHVVEVGHVHACYVILELKTGRWNVTLRHVPYDHRAMAQLAREKGHADWASALATGRLPPSV
jgi:diadenosine tetraphosphatase ApaH/serine/threonine PP2A family protein phosphatase